jgi:DNA excision repair protein ERCC-6-like
LIRGNSNYDDDEKEMMWNYVILDDGHLIENKETQRAQSLFHIPCVHRIVITRKQLQEEGKLKVLLQSPKFY